MKCVTGGGMTASAILFCAFFCLYRSKTVLFVWAEDHAVNSSSSCGNGTDTMSRGVLRWATREVMQNLCQAEREAFTRKSTV